jgi:hypothetical protein
VPKPLAPGELHEPLTITDWRRPLANLDLAIAPFPWPEDGRTHVALAVQFQFLPPHLHPPLAADIYYIGILTPLDRPMVRAGTLGALYQEGLDLTGDCEYTAHLVDCRSYDGFSGSPCFVEFAFPVLRTEDPVLPLPPEVQIDGRPRGVIDHLSILCGMFTEHLIDREVGVVSRYGVGVMLPSIEIWRSLMTAEMQNERQAWDDEHRAAAEAREPKLRKASAARQPDEFSRFEDLARKLVNTPKSEIDERRKSGQ